MRKFVESLTSSQLDHLIPVIEQGLEFEKLQYIATKDPESRCRIADTCIALNFLYIRKLDIDRTSS